MHNKVNQIMNFIWCNVQAVSNTKHNYQ